jgi:hypothetical protein
MVQLPEASDRAAFLAVHDGIVYLILESVNLLQDLLACLDRKWA